MTTIIKNTHELKTGDVVCEHGCRWELTERTVYEERNASEQMGDCIVFKTKLLSREENAICPAYWAEDWTIQGNKLAQWNVES